MSKSPGLGLVFGASLAMAVWLPAAAGEKDSFPTISGEIVIEIQNDLAYDSDDPTAEFNTLFTATEPSATVRFTEEISVFTGLVLEPVKAPAVAGDDQVFDNQGLFVETLTLNYDTERFSLFGGKFAPNFGSAWGAAPGIYGRDLPEGYEFAERIGFGGSVNFGDETVGRHTLSASTFFLDTSGLAESVITRRDRPRQADGGPGNTGDFSSFAVGLDGGGFKALPGFRYHLAYVHQGNGLDTEQDEKGFAVGAEYEIGITDDIGVTPLIEYVNLTDADGVDDQDRFYLTGALALTYRNWNLTLAGTRKETEAADGTETNEERFQVSAGYRFDSGIGLDLGWMTNRDAGVDTDTFGTWLTYTYEF